MNRGLKPGEYPTSARKKVAGVMTCPDNERIEAALGSLRLDDVPYRRPLDESRS
jgi:hypothetical protein